MDNMEPGINSAETSVSSSVTKKSPHWTPTTKLVIGLTLVAVIAGLLIYYRSVVSSLIFAFILTYLFHPVVKFISRKTGLSWRLTTTIIFILLILSLLGLFTVAGFAIAQQLQSLVRLLQEVTSNLPEIAENISQFLANYGAVGDLIDVDQIANRVIETLQPLLGQAGVIVRSIATGAAISIGKIVFVVAVAYFLLADADRIPDLDDLQKIPEYDYDIRRMSKELQQIWNTFFRGQIIIFVFVFIVYSILLSILGVRYAIILAVMTGLARFVPYVGPWITAIVMALVTFLQPNNYFGLLSWQYAAMVLGVAFSVDFVFDNYVAPRFFGRTLGIHPAAVLVAAILAANFLGLIGIFLAAPVVATLKLLGIYTFRKMFDLDPWPDPETEMVPVEFPWYQWGRKGWEQIQKWAQTLRKKGWFRFKR